MANVYVTSDCDIDFSEKETEVLVEAHKILRKTEKELWHQDAEESEWFDFVSGAEAHMSDLLKLMGIDAKN